MADFRSLPLLPPGQRALAGGPPGPPEPQLWSTPDPHTETLARLGEAVRSIFPGGTNRDLAEGVGALSTLPWGGATKTAAKAVGSLRAGVKAAGSSFPGVSEKFGRLVEIMASQKAKRGSPLWDDLVQEAWMKVAEVSPNLAAIPDEKKRHAKLAAAARGAMTRYVGETGANIVVPEEVRQARAKVRRAEARLEQIMTEAQQKRGESFTTPRITDRAIASLTGMSPSDVARHRADLATSGEARLDQATTGRALSAKIVTRHPTENPGMEPPAPPPELPVGRMATTPHQEQILRMYREGQSATAIAKDIGKSRQYVSSLIQKFKNEGARAPVKPIAGGSDVTPDWQNWYRSMMEDYRSGVSNVPPPKRPMSTAEEGTFAKIEREAFPGLARGFTNFRQGPVEPDPNIVRQLKGPHQFTMPSFTLPDDEFDIAYRRFLHAGGSPKSVETYLRRR